MSASNMALLVGAVCLVINTGTVVLAITFAPDALPISIICWLFTATMFAVNYSFWKVRR